MTKDSALMTFVQDAAACHRTADTFEIVFDSKARGAAGASLEISLILSPCGILCLFGWYFRGWFACPILGILDIIL